MINAGTFIVLSGSIDCVHISRQALLGCTMQCYQDLLT